jgi:putative SOS response-associated peptidase YedK
MSSGMINARAETVDTKPSFKNSFRRRRCLIPASGFYEWKKEGQKKIPFRIGLKGEDFLPSQACGIPGYPLPGKT